MIMRLALRLYTTSQKGIVVSLTWKIGTLTPTGRKSYDGIGKGRAAGVADRTSIWNLIGPTRRTGIGETWI